MSGTWSHHPDTRVPDESVIGFDVEAIDGSIGTVDEARHDPGDAYLVVDTGHWIFGKRRVVPARAIAQIDTEARKVFLRVTKDHIAAAPDHSAGWEDDEEIRNTIGSHFAEL
jgi:hypothetical protein